MQPKISSLLPITKSKNTVGIRVSDHYVPAAICAELGEPLVVSSFILPFSEHVITDCAELDDEVTNHLDLIVESEYCGYESTTVVNMLDVPYEVTRQGVGVVEGS